LPMLFIQVFARYDRRATPARATGCELYLCNCLYF
jgi:hypothetical protein